MRIKDFVQKGCYVSFDNSCNVLYLVVKRFFNCVLICDLSGSKIWKSINSIKFVFEVQSKIFISFNRVDEYE